MNTEINIDTPVYKHSAVYAREHEELPLYRESWQANLACKEAIEKAIADNYRDNHLNTESVLETLRAGFSMERIQYVLANTIQQKDWDRRFSKDNKAWAQSIPVAENTDAWGYDRNSHFVVDRPHACLTDGFATYFRKEIAREEKLEQKPSVLEKLQKPLPESDVISGRPKVQEL